MPWQVDVYRRPLAADNGETLWELVVCDPTTAAVWSATAPQSQVSADWVQAHLQAIAAQPGVSPPEVLQVFRPEALGPVTVAAGRAGLIVEPTRRTPELKQVLRDRFAGYADAPNRTGEVFDPVAIQQAPPQPLPEVVWGEEWQFGAIAAETLEATFRDLPMPIREVPADLLPQQFGLASTAKIPGVAVTGGRQSMRLARWLEAMRPAAIRYVATEAGASGGLVLSTGLAERWVLATFEDAEVAAAAQVFAQRQQEVAGLHFLLVQPDDSGMTYSGFWVLQA